MPRWRLPDPAKPAKSAGQKRPKVKRINAAEVLFAEQCKSQGLPEPRQQFRFAEPIGRRFTFDFCWPSAWLAVELDGGIWTRGAHGHPLDIERNMRKGNLAIEMGFSVLHFTPAEVLKSLHAVEFTERVLRSRLAAGSAPASGAAHAIKPEEIYRAAVDIRNTILAGSRGADERFRQWCHDNLSRPVYSYRRAYRDAVPVRADAAPAKRKAAQ